MPKTRGQYKKYVLQEFFEMSQDMDLAGMFESHTVCICRHGFRTDFSCKISSKSNVRESVDFEKNGLTSRISKNAKNVPWTWAGHFLYQLSNNAIEADILDRFGLHLNKGCNWGCLTLRYTENSTVFKSFEQCINYSIMLPLSCNLDPLALHFHKVKLGFIWL